MNKTELVELIADKAGISKPQASAALNAVTDGITAALKKGDDVTLVGFGTFRVADQAARTGHNPATGEAIKIKAKKAPKFKASSVLKEVVNSKKRK